MKLPRYYQTDAHEAIRGSFRRGLRRVLIELATGLGKTVIFVLMANMVSVKGGRVLILVNRDVLIEQALEELKINGVFAQREQGSERAKLTAQVVVSSVQSMQGKWLTKWPKDYFKLVVTDEAHGSAAATFKKILNHFISAYHVGVTATAERHDKRGLWAGYEEIVFSVSLAEGINDGWLCGFDFKDLDCPVTVDLKIAKQASIGENEEVFDSNKYLPRLAECAAEESIGRKGLFFLPNCRVSREFTDMLRGLGLEAEHIDSSYMPPRETTRLLEWFNGQQTGILCNSQLLTTGFNHPPIDVIGVFRPVMSLPIYKQMLGRGTRPLAPVDLYLTAEERRNAIAASTKPHCKVITPFWENGSHDLASPSALITDDEEERIALDKARKPGASINLEQLQLSLIAKRMTDKEEEMRKFAEKVANSQAAKKRGTPYIDDILKDKQQGDVASEKQYRFLYVLTKQDFRKHSLTKRQASRIIGRYQPEKAA